MVVFRKRRTGTPVHLAAVFLLMAVAMAVGVALHFEGGAGNAAGDVLFAAVAMLALGGLGMFMWWRRRYFEALRESRQLYSLLAESFEDFIFIVDRDDRITYVNHYAAAAFECGPEHLLGKRLEELLRPEDTGLQGKALRRVFETGISAQSEQVTRLPLGELRLDTKFIPLKGAKGEVEAVLGVARDITERIRVQEALAASEANYRAIFDNANDAIFIHDAETGAILDVNRKMCEMYGMTPDEARHLRVVDLSSGVAPYTEDDATRWVRASATEGPKLFEWHAKDKAGRLFWVEVNLRRAAIGGRNCILAVVRDITQRKEAEAALQRSHSLLAAALESTADGILVVDRDGKVTTFNRKFLELWRIPESLAASHDDQRLLQFVLDELAKPEEFLSKVQQLYRTPDASSLDELLFKDGRVFERFSLPQRVGDAIVGRVWNFRDITERRQVERALQMTQFAVDHASDAIFWVGADGHFLYVNDAACRNLEYTREELLSMTVSEIDPGMPAVLWPAHWEEVRRQKSVVLAMQHRSKEGRFFPVEITINFISFAGKDYLVTFVRDMTERKEAEEAIRRQQEFLRQVIDINPHFIFAKNREGKFTLGNEAVARAYGTSADGLIGKTDADFNPSTSEVDWFRSDDLEVIQSGKEMLIPEERITTASGETRFLRTIKRPLAPDQVLGVSVDITELKRAREQLESYSQDLERMVEERTHELDRARADLFASAKLAAMGRMGANIAHQLNSPLCGALLTIDGLLEDCAEAQGPCDRLESLRRAIEGMRSVVDCMLSLAMVSRRGASTRQRVDVGDMIRKIVEFSSYSCDRSGVRVELACEEGLPSLEATVGELDQVILNLIENAIDAMEGGGTITIRTARADHGIEIRIRDTGRGISTDEIEKIFEPFYSSGKKHRSLGLGLPIAREIVEKYGGTMTLQSAIGQGTEFCIRLPLVPPQ
jgi:PAS domain S-box-containing protein